MPTGKPLPFISQKSVRQALDALVYSASKSDNPLLYLNLVDEFLINPDFPSISNPREYALSHILGSTISLEFARQRQVFDIETPNVGESRDNVLRLIADDARISSPEIIGWSWFYHHFVRVDLNLSSEEFCAFVHIDERTLRRYQSHVLKRLTDSLVEAEWRTRTLQRKRRLYSELPVSTVFPIMGRDDLIGSTLQTLAELGSAHFEISGEKGVGKTAFVEKVLQAEIDRENIDQLIWIQRPLSCEYVRHNLLERLIPTGSQIGLREFFQMHRTVIVLDDAKLLDQDIDELYELLKLLAAATVFMTCNFDVPLLNTVQIAVAQLDQLTACNLIRYFFKTINGYKQIDEDTVQLIHKQRGGNPLALQLAVLHWPPMNFYNLSSNVGLHAMFYSLFESIDYELKCAWVVLAMLSPGVFEYAELHKMWPSLITTRSVDQLFEHHLLQVSQDGVKGHSLANTAYTFVRDGYHGDARIREVVENLFEHLDDGGITDVGYIEKLLMSDWFTIEEGKRTHWISEWWKSGLSSHHWSIWCVLLEANAKSSDPDIDLALGYATCLRHVGEVKIARAYLLGLIGDTGRKGVFSHQAAAMTELAILERQNGAYESAASLLAKAEHVSSRLKLSFLDEKLVFEKAQIAVDVRDVEGFAGLMGKMPHNLRTDILRSEMFLLCDDIEASRKIAERLLSLPDVDLTTKGHIHNILGRIFEHQNDLLKAEEHFSWCLMIVEKNDDSFSIARAQSNLASILLRLRYFDEARALLTNAEDLQLRLNDRVGLSATRHNLRQLEIDIATS